jgi:23S rRNA pseudouridine955/2504/2580 synthase
VCLPPAVTSLAGDRLHGAGRPVTTGAMRGKDDADVLQAMLLHEDKKVYVFNKPAGLAVQGGSGINRHVDDMLESLRNQKGEKPRLVHRLDRETSGVLVVARTRGAAVSLTRAFRERETEKIYWAICRGVPTRAEGRISTWLVREKSPDGDFMRVAKHGEPDADHAETHWRLVDQAGPVSWLELQPVTGRTHQLRVHLAHFGHPIIGDPKYFNVENWEFPGGIQKRLHLHARRIRIPHPDGGFIDVTAPLPPHMQQTFNLLGLDERTAGEVD